MRFSSQEIENAASDVNYMGGAKKLDSYINKFQINTSKTLLISGNKEIARGGRYDGLLKSLGAKKNIPAVGAAINLKNIWKIKLL